jgi:hypothetical protein
MRLLILVLIGLLMELLVRLLMLIRLGLRVLILMLILMLIRALMLLRVLICMLEMVLILVTVGVRMTMLGTALGASPRGVLRAIVEGPRFGAARFGRSTIKGPSLWPAGIGRAIVVGSLRARVPTVAFVSLTALSPPILPVVPLRAFAAVGGRARCAGSLRMGDGRQEARRGSRGQSLRMDRSRGLRRQGRIGSQGEFRLVSRSRRLRPHGAGPKRPGLALAMGWRLGSRTWPGWARAGGVLTRSL